MVRKTRQVKQREDGVVDFVRINFHFRILSTFSPPFGENNKAKCQSGTAWSNCFRTLGQDRQVFVIDEYTVPLLPGELARNAHLNE